MLDDWLKYRYEHCRNRRRHSYKCLAFTTQFCDYPGAGGVAIAIRKNSMQKMKEDECLNRNSVLLVCEGNAHMAFG